MVLDWYHVDYSLPKELVSLIKNEIEVAFDIDGSGKFVVNPKHFYGKQKGKLTRAVINSANYISGRFQGRLSELDWILERKLLNQKIDGYKEYKLESEDVVAIYKNEYGEVLKEIDPDIENYLNIVSDLHSRYYKRNAFTQSEDFPKKGFTHVSSSIKVRVGLEFETGNIASSFRAIGKMNVLYENDKIDVGVFITSIDKKVSTNIWPSSNRNGSIEELRNREFMTQIKFPAIIIGFAPDKWDESALFLGANKERFELTGETEEVEFNGSRFLRYKEWDYYEKIT
jgi:hypothetical protein